MSEMLEALSPDALELLSRADVPEPPAGAQAHVLARLQTALAPLALSAPAPAPHPPTGFGRFGIPVSVASLVVGALAATVLRPTTIVPPPIIIQVPAVVAPVVAERPAPLEVKPTPILKRAKVPAAVVAVEPAKPEVVNLDALLAEERNLLETARSALVRGEPKLAAEALQKHLSRFPAGRLAEERESLWIQALIRTGEFDQARAHAKQFREQFPRSLLLPAVDIALSSIPR